jgi:hypothetical protein
MNSKSRRYSLILAVGLITIVIIIAFVQPAMAQVDPNVPQVAVFPAQLERISWSAIIAGSIVALILQLAINLLAVGIGVSTINPMDSEDSASPKSLGQGAVAAIVISMIISLFIGGWMAARFSGAPERVDGLLHGVMVWGVVTLVTVIFLTTTIGRLMSGISSLLGQGLRLAGMATQTVAKGAANVAQGVAHGAASTVKSAADAAQDVAANAQNELEKSPEVADIMKKRDQVIANIKAEAAKIMQQTGVTPERVKAQAQAAGYQIQDAAKEVLQSPGDTERIFNETLTRILNQGQAITNQADQQAIIDIMVQRGNVTEEQAHQALSRWESGLRNTQQQLDYVTQQAKTRVNEVRYQAEAKVDDVKQDAERMARETAQVTTEAISKLALAAFAAIVIGIIAAGIGGYIGAPQDLPTARVSTSMQIETHSLHLFS